jgi:hypothetical protein
LTNVATSVKGSPCLQCEQSAGNLCVLEGIAIRQRQLSPDQYEIVDVRTPRGVLRPALLIPKAVLYDTADSVAGCRERGCTPHVSQNDTNRRSAIDARTTRHPGYRISTIKRKRIEEPFGWMKTVGGLRKTRHRGRGLVEWFFVLTATAYNLIRIPKIVAASG